MKHGPPTTRVALICALLAAATLVIYAPATRHGFVSFDDPGYVTDNPRVQAGLSLDGARWALSATEQGNWHPLTWLSHMLDAELWGPAAGGHHATSVLLHVANSLLLFLALLRMTAALWRSALVAALFALHPLHVESVAWIAERKDLLCALFGLLALVGYAGWVERGGAARYLATLGAFALGLASKPMLVTLPFVLLLLDFWPLGRLRGHWRARLGEKVPFLALAAASCVVTLLAQREAVKSLVAYPLALRLSNAAVSWVVYLRRTVWPVDLAYFYPFPQTIPAWKAAGAVALLLAVSALALAAARHRPYLTVGWLWYLGTLVPVIGIVQVGTQALADRYTYLPLVGVFLAFSWGLGDLVRGAGRRAVWLQAVPALAVALAAALSARQVGTWRDSTSLALRALAVTEHNAVAHTALGVELAARGEPERAIEQYLEALRIEPGLAQAHNDLGLVLEQQGRVEEALARYAEALRLRPDLVEAANNLGVALARQQRRDEAAARFEQVLRLQPDHAPAHNNLAILLSRRGDPQGAAAHFESALRVAPGALDVRLNLAQTLERLGRRRRAADEYAEVLRRAPDTPLAAARLAWILATAPDAALRDGARAVELAERASRATGDRDPAGLDVLAAAYAEAGRYADAAAAAERGIGYARGSGLEELARSIERRLAGYRLERPFREPS